jgi:ABC-type lipoprotein release transport system permease subunit
MQNLARLIKTLLHDIRLGFRRLMKQRGFAALAIISMALGAQLFDIQKLILKQGMFLAAIGSLGGLMIALGAARMMKSLLYGVNSSDPITSRVSRSSC